VDALNKNPVGSIADDDDFGAEIQDITDIQADVPRKRGELFCVKTGEETEWMGIRRKGRRFGQHDACCSGVHH